MLQTEVISIILYLKLKCMIIPVWYIENNMIYIQMFQSISKLYGLITVQPQMYYPSYTKFPTPIHQGVSRPQEIF